MTISLQFPSWYSTRFLHSTPQVGHWWDYVYFWGSILHVEERDCYVYPYPFYLGTFITYLLWGRGVLSFIWWNYLLSWTASIVNLGLLFIPDKNLFLDTTVITNPLIRIVFYVSQADSPLLPKCITSFTTKKSSLHSVGSLFPSNQTSWEVQQIFPEELSTVPITKLLAMVSHFPFLLPQPKPNTRPVLLNNIHYSPKYANTWT